VRDTLGSDAGIGAWATNSREKNIETAKQLLKEGGYKGETVVLLDPADTPIAQVGPWMILFPGTFLAVVVLAVNLVGDGFRDLLDPRFARRL
jgi:hypothetical protein